MNRSDGQSSCIDLDELCRDDVRDAVSRRHRGEFVLVYAGTWPAPCRSELILSSAQTDGLPNSLLPRPQVCCRTSLVSSTHISLTASSSDLLGLTPQFVTLALSPRSPLSPMV
jgi:hypothetical protein